MLRRRALRADHIKIFCLDEADEMLSRGFKDQIYDIFQLLPPNLQVGVFSATLPPEALEITRKFMNKPVSSVSTTFNLGIMAQQMIGACYQFCMV